MARFIVNKTDGYTVMSNNHLRNGRLTLKAKGLLSLMLSLPEDWNYNLKGLSAICQENIDTIRKIILELEEAGYVNRYRERDEHGRLAGVVYEIYEVPPSESKYPDEEEPIADLSEFFVKPKEEKSEGCSRKNPENKGFSPEPKNSVLDKTPKLKNPVLDKNLPKPKNSVLDKTPKLKNPILEKTPKPKNPNQVKTAQTSKDIYKYINNNYTLKSNNISKSKNNNISKECNKSNHILSKDVIYNTNVRDKPDSGYDEIRCDKPLPGGYVKISDKDLYEVIRREVREDIDLDSLLVSHAEDAPMVKEIYGLITETLYICARQDAPPEMLIASKMYPRNVVEKRLSDLRYCHIEYVLENINRTTSDIRNIKKYILAALFNAPMSISVDMRVRVNGICKKYYMENCEQSVCAV